MRHVHYSLFLRRTINSFCRNLQVLSPGGLVNDRAGDYFLSHIQRRNGDRKITALQPSWATASLQKTFKKDSTHQRFEVLQHLEQLMRFVKTCVNLCDKTTVCGNSTRFTEERKKKKGMYFYVECRLQSEWREAAERRRNGKKRWLCSFNPDGKTKMWAWE